MLSHLPAVDALKVMRIYALLLLLLPGFSWSYSEESFDCANAFTTLEINACMNQDLEQAEADLERYFGEAMARYSGESGIQEALNKSQQVWLAYRKAHCDAVYQQWSGGTIRGVMLSGCMLKLTKIRRHMIWEAYLTYMDSSPPILPEPEL